MANVVSNQFYGPGTITTTTGSNTYTWPPTYPQYIERTIEKEVIVTEEILPQAKWNVGIWVYEVPEVRASDAGVSKTTHYVLRIEGTFLCTSCRKSTCIHARAAHKTHEERAKVEQPGPVES